MPKPQAPCYHKHLKVLGSQFVIPAEGAELCTEDIDLNETEGL
jgi:hypothetical protein